MKRSRHAFATFAAVFALLIAPPALAKRRHKKKHRPPSYSQKIQTTSDTRTLGELSVYLYGTDRYTAQLARWNRLRAPYVVSPGRTLVIRRKPTLTAEAGRAKLLAMWRRRFGLEELTPAARPLPLPSPSPSPVPRPAPSPEPEPATDGEFAPAAPDTEPVPVAKLSPLPPPPDPAPQDAFDEGRTRFAEGSYEKALAHFHAAREKNPKFLPGWLMELKTLKMLRRDDETGAVARACVQANPALANLPEIRAYLNGAAGPAEGGPLPRSVQ